MFSASRGEWKENVLKRFNTAKLQLYKATFYYLPYYFNTILIFNFFSFIFY